MKNSATYNFKQGRKDGLEHRRLFDSKDATFSGRAEVTHARRKAMIGIKSTSPALREYWLGWTDGFNID